MRFKVKKNCIILLTVLYIVVAPLCPVFLKRAWVLQSSSFLEARHALIGQLSNALWLAKYLKRETEMLPPHLIVMPCPWRNDTKTIKPIINKAFFASSGDIITDYNDLYCLFKHYYYTLVIGEKTNDKHYSTLLKTRVWTISSRKELM